MQTVGDLQLFRVLKYTITGNKYKFALIIQETATNVYEFGQLLYNYNTIIIADSVLGCIGDECTDEYLELTSTVEGKAEAGNRALGAFIQ